MKLYLIPSVGHAHFVENAIQIAFDNCSMRPFGMIFVHWRFQGAFRAIPQGAKVACLPSLKTTK